MPTTKKQTKSTSASAIADKRPLLACRWADLLNRELMTITPECWSDIRIQIKRDGFTVQPYKLLWIQEAHGFRLSLLSHAAFRVFYELNPHAAPASFKFNGFAPPAELMAPLNLLGIEFPVPSFEVAQKAWKQAIAEAHPDNGGNDADAAVINNAWDQVKAWLLRSGICPAKAEAEATAQKIEGAAGDGTKRKRGRPPKTANSRSDR